MKNIIFTFLILFTFNISAFSATAHESLINECKSVSKEIKKTPLLSVNKLLIRASEELAKNYDEKLLVSLVGLLKSSYSVDSNYYSIEFIYPALTKHKVAFDKEVKKQFSKKGYKTFNENVALFENEQKVGNDPKSN